MRLLIEGCVSPMPTARNAVASQQDPEMRRQRDGEEAEHDGANSGDQHPLLAEALGQPADEPALDERREHADEGQHVADLRRAPADWREAHSAKVVSHAGEGEDDGEEVRMRRRRLGRRRVSTTTAKRPLRAAFRASGGRLSLRKVDGGEERQSGEAGGEEGGRRDVGRRGVGTRERRPAPDR